MTELRQYFEQNGVSPLLKVMPGVELEALQQLIYDATYHLIEDHDVQLTLSEKLNLPFKETPSYADWAQLMQKVNTSEQLQKVMDAPKVLNIFKQMFDNEPVRYPISLFRAQFPGITSSTFDWHQDMGTWYIVPKESLGLAEKIAVTMWFSIGHADENNSIEIAMGTQKLPLLKHYEIEKQGFFQAKIGDVLDLLKIIRVTSNPGDGILMHPLTLHRSVTGTNNVPRYSIDIRYYDPEVEAAYKVDPEFEIQRKKFVAES